MFQLTHGTETEKGAWLRWLKTLGESLVSPGEQSSVGEKQQAQSVMLHESLQGTGFTCGYMATKYGEIGINDEEEKPDPPTDDYMLVRQGIFKV